jgi:hypothetical protein
VTDSNAQPPDESQETPPPPPPDDGLRRLLTWTFIALGVTLVLAAIGVTIVVYWFEVNP